METVFAVMLLLGCDQSMMVCRQANDPVRSYVSVEACQADARLMARFGSDFERPVTECLEVEAPARVDQVAVDWHVDPAGELHAVVRIRDTGPLLALAD